MTELFQESMPQLLPYELEALDTGKDCRHYKVSENVVDSETHIPDEQSEEAIRYAPYPDGCNSKLSQRVKVSPSVSKSPSPSSQSFKARIFQEH